MEADAPPPILIAGKYQLVKQLERGAGGALWRARHVAQGTLVAVKLMDPAIASSADGLQRFVNEASAIAAMRSPHVVQILDHGVDGGTPFVVLELIEAETLAARLAREARLSPAVTARIVMHVARALSLAQRAGIVHRNLKPDKVLLLQREGRELAKLDFGVAELHKRSWRDDQAAGAALTSTSYYVSPEQAEGQATVDHRSDIWALGVIAYECLVGRRPFEGASLPLLVKAICHSVPPVPSMRAQVPAGFDAWFVKACARRLADRFSSALEAAEGLARICGVPELTAAKRKAAALAPARNDPSLTPAQQALLNELASDDEAPTEIWRDPVPEAPSALPPPPASLPSSRPAPQALRRDKPQSTASTTPVSSAATIARSPSGALPTRAFALAALAVVSVSIGLWLATRESPASGLAAAAGGSVAAKRQAAAVVTPSSSSANAEPSPSTELVPTIDLNQLPVAPKSRVVSPPASLPPFRVTLDEQLSSAAPAPAPAPASASASAEPPSPIDEVVNPYR